MSSSGKTSASEALASESMVARLAKLAVPSVADALDRLGLHAQVLDPRIRPLAPGTVAGTAFTWLASTSLAKTEESFDRGIEAVDEVIPGSIVVITTGGTTTAASWGELLSTRARARGGVGTVTDGAVRDVAGIKGLGYPVFTAGVNSRDARLRLTVLEYGVPIVCGGVVVNNGDLVLADEDGVVVIPVQRADEVMESAEGHLALEVLVRRELEAGVSARIVFDRHNVL